MATLGKCLIFYLKYPVEMKRLYEQEEEPEGIEEMEKTLEMVRAVGDASGRQAADFLTECGECIQEHFGTIARCQIVSKRSSLEKRWSVSCGVWLKGKFKPKLNKWRVMAGVDIIRKEGGLVAPWLWLQGKSGGEEQLVNVLKERVKARSEDMGWDAGTVGLAKIPLIAAGQAGFDVEKDPLIKQVRDVFRAVTPMDLQVLTLVNV